MFQFKVTYKSMYSIYHQHLNHLMIAAINPSEWVRDLV